MTEITVQLTLGFKATPYYNHPGTDDDYRIGVKKVVKQEIDKGVLPVDQALALSLLMDVPEIDPDTGDRPPTPEQDVIDRINLFFTDYVNVDGDDISVHDLQDIVYVWEGGNRYCEHSYSLNRAGNLWVEPDEYQLQSYSIIARLRWN